MLGYWVCQKVIESLSLEMLKVAAQAAANVWSGLGALSVPEVACFKWHDSLPNQ